jgi:YebC/PmpR family DNA-binding regulatory protein
MLIECLTDNRNRAAAEVRTIMSRNGGQMGDPGSVAYNFARKGVVSVMKVDGLSEDDVLLAVLDAGAEEVIDRGVGFEVITEPANLVATRQAIQLANIDYEAADVEFLASATVAPERDVVEKVFKLIDALEDSDDVQNVYTNMEPSPEVLDSLDDDA